MPRKITIDVEANIVGTQRVLTTLSNQLTALRHQADTISSIENRVAGRTLGQGQAGTGFGDPRPYIAQVQTSYQQFGNTVKQVATWVKELNGSLITGTATTYGGSLEKVLAAQEAYRIQLEKAAPIEDKATARIAKLSVMINDEALAWEHLEKAQYRVGKGPGGTLNVRDANTGQIVKGDALQFLQASDIYERAQKRISKLNLPSFEKALEAERNAPPPLPQNIAQIARQSPDLLRTLVKGGIGLDTRQLYDTGAAQSLKVQEDLVRGVTRVTGAWTDQNGILRRINAEYDRAGNVTTTFGGRLRNIGSAITQTGRDILKMSEWAVAAVAVYGAFNKIGESVGTIITVDKQLRQLGITANLTNAQVSKLFGSLADVAIETATPVTELLGAADNIALAVKRVGDTTEQTEAKIISFARSVGILTNLTGIDTVKGTDLLTSAYKQLGLTVDEIPGLLDKVTAVAGGQSNAISDVITAVAQLGEAAKVGNLSLSELVGTVQTLSQVTAKTPAEVATSLKNLIGSIGSPGSIKALKSYGIELKDTQGNLKSLLQIYGELATKFSTGAIPESDQQAVIRAISGGPRRAPDAAALLGSYNQIANAVRVAAAASNESTIANLKVLDSASAKMVQLQAAFDKFTVGKFSDLVRDSVGNLAEILTKLLAILDKLDPSVYEFLGTMALVAVGAKGLGFIFGNIAGLGVRIAENLGLMNRASLNAARGYTELAREANKAANSIRNVSTASRGAGTPTAAGGIGGVLGGIGGAIGRNRSSLVPIAAGVATGAALDVATGADPKTLLQNILLGGGLAALTVPEPTGITKLIAAVGILGGGLLALIPEEKKVETQTGATVEELLQSVTAYQAAAAQINAIALDNAALGKSIDVLIGKQKAQKASAEELQTLSGQQEQYAKNVLASIKANVQLQDSFDELRKNIENIPGLSTSDRADLKVKISAAIDGKLDPETLKKLTATITEDFLKQADPTKYGNVGNFEFQIPLFLAPDKEKSLTAFKNILVGLKDLVIQAQPGISGPSATGTSLADSIIKSFGPASVAGGGTGQVQPNSFVDRFLGANKTPMIFGFKLPIGDLVDQVTKSLDPLDKYQKTLNQIAIDQQSLASQGLLHIISADEVDRGTKLLDLLANAVKLRQQFKPTRIEGTTYDTGQGQLIQADKDVANVAGTVFKAQTEGFQLTRDEAISAGESILRLSGRLNELKDKGAAVRAIQDYFADLGYTIKLVADEQTKLNKAVDEFKDLRVQNTKDIRGGFIDEYTSLINQRNQLQSNIRGEQLTPVNTKQEKEARANRIAAYQEELAAVNASISGSERLRIGLLNLNKVSPTSIVTFKKELSEIPGLEAIAFTDTKNLGTAIAGLATTFGLTGKQIVTFTTAILQLIKDIQALDGLKAEITVQQNFVQTYTSIGEDPTIAGRTGIDALNYAYGGGKVNPLQAQIDQLNADKKKQQDIIDRLLKAGQGSAFGKPDPVITPKTPKTPKAPDVSNLDVGDPIYKAINRQALIEEAIQRARTLQHKIPGEDKEAKDDIVALLHGTTFLENVRGVKEEYLRKAIEELTDVEKKRLDFDTKADQIRRIRVGSGDFAAIANVPFNSTSGVSVGGPNGPINVNLNLSGQVLTPAQFDAMANKIASIIKRSIANG